MDDRKIKELLALAVEYRLEIFELLKCQNAEEIKKGIFALEDSLCNSFAEKNLFRFGSTGPKVRSLKLSFENGYINLRVDAEVEKIGPLHAEYMVEINDLRFGQDAQQLYATFTESLSSGGNMLQQAALKAATVGGTALGKVTKLAKIDFVYVDGNRLMVDFSKVDKIKKAADSLELTYRSCENGLLKLQFQLV